MPIPAAVIADELSPRPVQRPQPAITEIEQLRRLHRRRRRAHVAPIIHKLASRLLALTAVRLAALRGGRWAEIEDLDGPRRRNGGSRRRG
jgi:integrase